MDPAIFICRPDEGAIRQCFRDERYPNRWKIAAYKLLVVNVRICFAGT